MDANQTSNLSILCECVEIFNGSNSKIDGKKANLVASFERNKGNLRLEHDHFHILRRTVEFLGNFEKSDHNETYTFFEIFNMRVTQFNDDEFIYLDIKRPPNNEISLDSKYCKALVHVESERPYDDDIPDDIVWKVKNKKQFVRFVKKLFDGSELCIDIGTSETEHNYDVLHTENRKSSTNINYYIDLRLRSYYDIDKNNARELNKEIEWIRNLIERIYTDPFLDIGMIEYQGENLRDVQNEYHRVMSMCSPQSSLKYEFLGSMPVNLSRKHFSLIKQNDYFVSDKTDGVRYMVLFYRNQMFLINRSHRFYTVPRFNNIHAWLTKPDTTTLIDGEMVRNHRTYSPNFLMFDSVMINGHFIGSMILEERLKMSISSIVNRYRNNRPPGSSSHEGSDPFQFLGKFMMPKSKIHNIIRLISDKNGGRFFDDSQRRCHKVDGLIMAPGSTPYQLKTDKEMFKWKYLDLVSIDFRVEKLSKTSVDLCLGTEKYNFIKCISTYLTEEDYNAITNDIRLEQVKVVIAEFVFNKKEGMWRYKHLRPDKDKPNHLTIGFSTMESVIEDVETEEVVSIMSKE